MQVSGDVRNTDLVRITGINAATVSRTLSTLVDAGYVQYVPESGRYRLGVHLLELSNHVLAGLDLRGLATYQVFLRGTLDNAALDTLEPLDRIRKIFWRLYEFSRQHPQYFELMFVDRSVPRISEAYERFGFAREMKTRLIAQIQACIDAKALPEHLNPHVACRLLTMGLMGAAMMRLSGRLKRGEDVDALARDVINVTLRGLQSGIALESTFVDVDCSPNEVPASMKVS